MDDYTSQYAKTRSQDIVGELSRIDGTGYLTELKNYKQQVKNKRKRKIHRDKNGREFIKEAYFVGGKMKFNRIYLIDGIPAIEYYEKNATDLDFYLNGDYELINSKNDYDNDYDDHFNEPDNEETDSLKNIDFEDLPF